MTKFLVLAAIAGAALAAAATAAAPTLTLVANASIVAYGKPVVLSGALSTQRTNQTLGLQATECGSTKAVKVATVKTVAAGAYSTSATPALATKYQVTFKNATKSPVVAVSVRPVLQLVRVARNSYTAKVTAGASLKGKAVLFQRYSRLRKRWVQVKRVLLGASTAGPAKPTMITTASFKAKVARRTRVRLLISVVQAAPCYLTAVSRPIRA